MPEIKAPEIKITLTDQFQQIENLKSEIKKLKAEIENQKNITHEKNKIINQLKAQ